MTFRWPVALALLLLIPLGGVVAALARRRRARFAVSFTNVDVLRASMPRVRRRPQRVAAALFALALCAIIVGAARPQAEFPVPREDATVVLVMDSSGSMVSTDVLPSRLDAAKQAARTFVDVVPDRLRVGLVGFSSIADVLAWPTTDRDFVRRALREIQPTGATAIGDGLMKALRVMGLAEDQSQSDPDRSTAPPVITSGDERLFAVLLLSDGRNNAGRTKPQEATDLARRLGVPVYTVALGTPSPLDMGPIPGVVEPVDTRTLRSIADQTGGAFFEAADDQTLDRIYANLGSRIGYEQRNEEITFAFAGGAAALLCGATIASLLRRPALP